MGAPPSLEASRLGGYYGEGYSPQLVRAVRRPLPGAGGA